MHRISFDVETDIIKCSDAWKFFCNVSDFNYIFLRRHDYYFCNVRFIFASVPCYNRLIKRNKVCYLKR